MFKKVLLVICMLLMATNVNAAWLDIDSTEYYSHCGDTLGHTAQEMLDGTDAWWHLVNHEHELIVDLGSSANVAKIRTKNDGLANNDDIDVYVSDNPASWGTAVMTGIDISGDSDTDWTERVLDVQKSGRYVKVTINTTQINNWLGWGDDDTKVLDLFTGVLPQVWTSVINLTAQNYTTSSASYVPTNGSLTMFPWDGSKFSNISAAYFEVTGNIIGTSEGDTWGAQLYDRTNTTEVAAVSAFGPGIARSGDISASLDAGQAALDVRVKNKGATSVALKSARLIIVQNTSGTDKTAIYIPVGQTYTIGLNSYQSGRDVRLTASCEHQFEYIADNWETVENAYFHAVMYGSGANTAYAALDDVAEGREFGEVSTSNSVPTLLFSSDIKASLVDGTVYTAFTKSSANRQNVNMVHAWLEIDLNTVNKYEFMYDVTAFGKKETGTTGWKTESTEYRVEYFTGDMWYFGLDSEITKHYSVESHNSATSIIGALYDDGTKDADSEIKELGGTPVYETSIPLTFADGSEIKSGWNVASLGFLSAGYLWNSGILVTVELDDGEVASTFIPTMMWY